MIFFRVIQIIFYDTEKLIELCSKEKAFLETRLSIFYISDWNRNSITLLQKKCITISTLATYTDMHMFYMYFSDNESIRKL